MTNGFEFMKLRTERLPESWQEAGALAELEQFLQEDWRQRAVFYRDGQVAGRQQFIDFDRKNGIKLQNYVGTILFRGGQLNIFPKIFKEDEDDFDGADLTPEDLIKNLVYWLGYCDRLHFPFLSVKSQLCHAENLLELFITVYAHYVKAAVDWQRYYQYEEIREKGTIIKGRINFNTYARNYASGYPHYLDYTCAGFVFDNQMNRIIKCTCQYLLNLTCQEGTKQILRNILMKLGDVASRMCRPADCDGVHLNLLRSDYRMILSMSRMFLLNQTASCRTGMADTFCFLFPAEMLFEGFLSGFIKEMFQETARVRTQTGDQYLASLVVDGENLGDVFRLREDILLESEYGTVVVDAKYKEIDRFRKVKENRKLKVSDNDVKQMAVYAARRGAGKLFLIYPLHRNEEPETMEVRYDINLGADGTSACIPMEILKVPFALRESEEKTGELLRVILGKMNHTLQ